MLDFLQWDDKNELNTQIRKVKTSEIAETEIGIFMKSL